MRINGKIVGKFPWSEQLPNGTKILIVRKEKSIINAIWCGIVTNNDRFQGFRFGIHRDMMFKSPVYISYNLLYNETLYEITDTSFDIINRILTYQDFLKVFNEDIVILNKL